MVWFPTQYRQWKERFNADPLCCPHFPVPLPKPLKPCSSRDGMALRPGWVLWLLLHLWYKTGKENTVYPLLFRMMLH